MHRWANSNQDSPAIGELTESTQWTFLEHPTQVIKELMPLSPIGYLLHKANLLRLGDIADIPNTQNSQNKEIKKHAANKRTRNPARNKEYNI